jgi:hypothetical protein
MSITNPQKSKGTVPLFLHLPPDERERLATFCELARRPLSWVARDAIRLYLDAIEKDPSALLKVKIPLDIGNAGKTKRARLGRPPQRKERPNEA